MALETKDILTRPASIAFGVIMLFGGIALASATIGWRARGTVEGAPPIVATAGLSLPPGTISLDERLHGIEDALRTLQKDMTEVKQRLPKKP